MLKACYVQVGLFLLAAVLCTSVDSTVPDVQSDYPSLHYRDESEQSPESTELEKPVREDGLGSLLLKNLRFRDVDRLSRQLQPLQWLLKSRLPEEEGASGAHHGNSYRPGSDEFSKGVYRFKNMGF